VAWEVTEPSPSGAPPTAAYDGEVKIRSAIVYTVLRLLAFLVPFAIMVIFFPIFRQQYWLAAIFAALIGLSLSLLFLRRPLDEVTTALAERRAAEKSVRSDEEVEDAAAGDDDAPR
jgi:ABC-type siderophore export system fused ATPase/permease subunit